MRLVLPLINKGTPCLRQIIADWLKKKHLTFDMFLDQNKAKFEGASFFDRDICLLYRAPGGRPKDLLERLDLTMLVLLIGHSKILPQAPPSGWLNEPYPNHTDNASDIVRLRRMRNDLYHLPQCAVVDDEFEKKWTTLTDALIRLGAVDRSIRSMKTRHFNQLQKQHKAYAKLIRELFSRDKYFVRKYLQKGKKLDCRQSLQFELTAHQSGSEFGYNMAKRCTKCNTLSVTICSHCSSMYY